MKSQPQFTPQQAAAIETRGVSIALSAGAGCGKTFVLTRRFLAGLEPGADPRSGTELHQLVAITFTDRAAREMRDRIRSACDERLQNCQPDEVGHWLEILRGLDSARISTIHSFCTSLLRSQAVEAGLDPRFNVLDAALTDTLLRNVTRQTLHQLIETGDADAVEFVVQMGLERAEEILRKLTGQRFQMDFARFIQLAPEQLEAIWLERWHSDLVPRLVSTFRESQIVGHVLDVIRGAPSKNETMIDRIGNLSSLLPSRTPWRDVTQVLAEIHHNARVQGGGGKKDWVSEETQSNIKLAFEKLRSEVTALKEQLEFSREEVKKSTELACRAVRLVQRTADDYAAAKRAQGALDFDDLLLHARNLLRDNESVRHRVAAGIRLLMVDEFQDTDPVQADVVRSLCGAALTRGKLFMVGDRKQSIYRFRRADPTVFATMSDELPPSGRLLLNVNFRSQPAVLNFVNHLFAPSMKGYEPLVPFHSVQQSPTPAVEFLFARFDADEASAEAAASSHWLSDRPHVPDDEDVRPNAPELRRREADWIARRICEMLADPTPRIRSREKDAARMPRLRRTEPGDIVILFRALTSVQDYEAALRKFGLDYYLVGGKAFFAQQEIFDLLNLCRYLDDCDDEVGLIGILRSPFFNLRDDTLQALVLTADSPSEAEIARNPDLHGVSPSMRAMRSLHEALSLEPPAYLPSDQQSRVRFASEVLSDLRQRKDRVPLSDLLTEAVERTGYDASILAEFLGERKLANLRKLIEMARQFDQGDFVTLKDFVTRLQTSVLEETDEEFATTQPESGDVIRLMSIHQSKGLEFPVVIVADIDRKKPPRGSDAVLHPEFGPLIKLPEQFGKKSENLALRMHKLAEEDADAEETIRLFYVACTRAADYLILSTGMDPDKPSQSPWKELIEQRFDINTGLLKTDPILGSSTGGTADPASITEILIHAAPCQAMVPTSVHQKRIAPGELPGRVLTAQPGDFPESSRRFDRDASDVDVISVSRLEGIDAELSGTAGSPAAIPRRIRETEDEAEVDRDQATSLGIIIHEVLERVDFTDPSTWPELLLRAVRDSSEVVHDAAIEQARTMLTRFFDSPLAGELSEAKAIYREIDFLLPWPVRTTMSAPVPPRTPLISGIIDLLVETEAGWHILDYKTGDFPSTMTDDQLLGPYELQLGLYAYAVEQWFGVVPREIALVTFRPQVRRIKLSWSAQRWQEIQSRIERALLSLRKASSPVSPVSS